MIEAAQPRASAHHQKPLSELDPVLSWRPFMKNFFLDHSEPWNTLETISRFTHGQGEYATFQGSDRFVSNLSMTVKWCARSIKRVSSDTPQKFIQCCTGDMPGKDTDSVD